MLRAAGKVNSSQAWIVVIIASLFFCYEFMQISMFNALGGALMEGFEISPAQYGHLSAFYFYGNLIFLMPAGIVLDRLSTRRVLCLMTVMCTLATFWFSTADALWVAESARFITGVGGAFAFLIVLRLATRWFSNDRLALVIGMVVTLAMFGGMMAQTPFVWMAEHLGWRQTLVYDGFLGVISSLLIFMFVKDSPTSQIQQIEGAGQQLSEVWGSFKLALLNRQNWLGGVIISLLNLPIFIFGATWGSLYLMQVHHMTTYQASFITSMIFVGMIVGSPLIGWYSDHYSLKFKAKRIQLIKLGNRRQPLLISAVASCVSIIFLIASSALSWPTLMVLFFLMGLFCSMHIVGYPLIAESNPPHLTASAGGISSMLIMAGGFILPLFGWCMSLMGDVRLVGHAHVYSLMDYRIGMAVLPIAYILAGWAAYCVKDSIQVPAISIEEASAESEKGVIDGASNVVEETS